MLESVKITRRQSEIRQALAGLVGKATPTEDETRSMETLDAEYRQNEVRYRAALIAEDTERREAKDELETRGDREYAELINQFELRQIALALDEGAALSGATAEVVTEMRSKGGYRGLPIPLGALEVRTGETVASGVPDPTRTMPIVDRLFPQSVAARMGVSLINIDSGITEWPVVTSAISASWAASETGDVGAPAAFATTDKQLKPNQNYGVQMTLTRRSMKQSGPALEDAVRRDLNSAIGAGLDKAIFMGTGSAGQPLGIVYGAATYGITQTSVDAPATWAAIRTQVAAFMKSYAANAPSDVRLLAPPALWAFMDGELITNTAVSEWDRLLANIPAGNIALSYNALPDVISPATCSALLTTTAGGVAPAFVGLWGGVDLVRDVYTKAASGELVLTGILTADVTVARPAQSRVLTSIDLF